MMIQDIITHIENKSKFVINKYDISNKHCYILDFSIGEFSLELYVNNYEDDVHTYYCYLYHNGDEHLNISPEFIFKSIDRTIIVDVVNDINEYFSSINSTISNLVIIRRDWNRI